MDLVLILFPLIVLEIFVTLALNISFLCITIYVKKFRKLNEFRSQWSIAVFAIISVIGVGILEYRLLRSMFDSNFVNSKVPLYWCFIFGGSNIDFVGICGYLFCRFCVTVERAYAITKQMKYFHNADKISQRFRMTGLIVSVGFVSVYFLAHAQILMTSSRLVSPTCPFDTVMLNVYALVLSDLFYFGAELGTLVSAIYLAVKLKRHEAKLNQSVQMRREVRLSKVVLRDVAVSIFFFIVMVLVATVFYGLTGDLDSTAGASVIQLIAAVLLPRFCTGPVAMMTRHPDLRKWISEKIFGQKNIITPTSGNDSDRKRRSTLSIQGYKI